MPVVRQRYRLDRLPALALAVAVPVGGVMLFVLADAPIRRDLGLLVAVATVIVLAWLGGLWPGLISTLLLVVLFAGPMGLDQFLPALDDLSLFLFAVAGLVGTGVAESLYRARWRVEAARDRARTSRRAEHAVRSELESIVAAIGDGIMVVEADHTISLTNEAATELVGHHLGRFEDLEVALAPSENGTNPADHISHDGPMTTEYRLADQDRRVELSSFPLPTEGEPDRRVVLLRDVTEARRRDALRDAFLSLLSHELRTPMTAVYGGATLLQRIGDRLDAATRNDIRADIVSEAERLSRLIDDLLVLTRAEGGVEVGKEPALLQHLVADVASQDGRLANRTTIAVSADPGLPPVMGDDTSIRQVTHNLISNAIKYSPPGSPIDVVVEAADDEVVVRVLDRGRGLSGDESARVFEPFYRGAETASTASGVGIGLFVCQRLVEAMGGRIWTHPRDGGGSEFGFALPVWPMDADDEELPPVPVEAGRTGPSW